MTGNCLFHPFLFKYIHINTYFVKKRDSYKIFWLRMKISWEPGSQVPRNYPTLHCFFPDIGAAIWSIMSTKAVRTLDHYQPECSRRFAQLSEVNKTHGAQCVPAWLPPSFCPIVNACIQSTSTHSQHSYVHIPVSDNIIYLLCQSTTIPLLRSKVSYIFTLMLSHDPFSDVYKTIN